MELHALIHEEDDGTYWAEVKELPGCFASGSSLDELMEGLIEAIGMCLPEKRSVRSRTNGAKGRAARVDEMKLVTA
jgi:predicted RNase H-like HicB family nuclease